MNGLASENPFATAFLSSTVILVLALAAFLSLFTSPLIVLGAMAAAAFLWAIFQYPVWVLGAVLAFMPVDYLAIELGKFFGLPAMTLVSACTKEIPLLLLLVILWRRNGFKPAAPDWLLLAFCAIATLYTLYDGIWAAWAIDLDFALAYFVGRMAVLTGEQERRWAARAVWIVAILSVLGLSEVFIFGEGPRTLLYLSTGSMTENGSLTASFHAEGFTGLREAATMVGPNGFGALCMIALIIWWAYHRNPLPGAMIATGLVCSLTRAAWVGCVVAIPLLAFLMGQKRRLFLYGALALALFAASIPVLGLGEFLFTSKAGQDLSEQGHLEEITGGIKYVAQHPFGSGNGRLNRLALINNANATVFETTYPTLAGEYGILGVFCFVGFLGSALSLVWRRKSRLGYAAAGILAGLAVVMIFTLPLDDRRLAYWALFPIGLAVQSAIGRDAAAPAAVSETLGSET